VLIVAVGSFRPNIAEVAPATVSASDVRVDDLEGARHEAGDLIRADIDWDAVGSLAEPIRDPLPNSRSLSRPLRVAHASSRASAAPPGISPLRGSRCEPGHWPAVEILVFVIPAKAGTQLVRRAVNFRLGPGLRRGDNTSLTSTT
jgi:hypothetical protein